MKKVSKIVKMLVLTLMLSFVFEVTSPLVFDDVVVAQAATKVEVKINAAKKSLTIGQTFQLRLRGTTKKPAWSSSDKTVATVSKNGKVTAKAEGTATITAKINKKKYNCEITVKAATSQIVSDAPFTAKEIEVGPYTTVVPKDCEPLSLSYKDTVINYYVPSKNQEGKINYAIMTMAVPADELKDVAIDYSEFLDVPDLEETLAQSLSNYIGQMGSVKDTKLSVAKKGANSYLKMDCVVENNNTRTINITAYYHYEDGYITGIALFSYVDSQEDASINDVVDYMLTSLSLKK